MLNLPSLHHDCCCAHRSCSVVLGYMIKTHNNILLIGSNRDTSNYDDASMEISNSIGYHDLDDIQIYHGPLNQIKSLCKSNLGCPAPRFFGVPWCRDPQPPGLNLHVFRSACVFFYLRKIINPKSDPLHQYPKWFCHEIFIKTNNGPWKIRCIFSSPKRSMFYEVSPHLLTTNIMMIFIYIYISDRYCHHFSLSILIWVHDLHVPAHWG